MKAGTMLVLYVAILSLCTFEILGNPILNLEKAELSKLVDSELLSYIENKINFKLKELDNKEVRSNELAKRSMCKPNTKPEPPKEDRTTLRPHGPWFPSINGDCVIGDLILSAEDCEKLKKKIF